MTNHVQTAWVRPPHETGGLDHLGVKAPVIHIFGELLPGITNVTDRARYYSFYPWLVWRLDEAGIRDWDETARTYIRRADCLFTLIANYHDHKLDHDGDPHALGLVGNLTLAKVAQAAGEGAAIDLDRYATEDEGEERYFKNKLGGLGQYYIGSLRDVMLLGGDAKSGLRYTEERGGPLATAFAAQVDGDRFWHCIETARVDAKDLDALMSFCPCHLKGETVERQKLIDIFFARDEFAIEAGKTRRASLGLLLHLARELDSLGAPFNVHNFRGALYGGSLPNGSVWKVPDSLQDSQRRWATYVANEVLSVGLQGAFYATLAWLQQFEPARDAKQMAAWLVEDEPGQHALKQLKGKTVSELLSSVEKRLPPVDAWTDPAHEFSLAKGITEAGNQPGDAETLGSITAQAMQALASLAIRLKLTETPYQWVTFPPGYFQGYPLNLRTFKSAAQTRWPGMSVSAWMEEIIAQWCVNAHIRVALRKLRGHSQATFQVRPTEQGFLIKGAPEPEFSNPRFKQARQMLVDTGCLEALGDKRFALTALGSQMLDDAN